MRIRQKQLSHRLLKNYLWGFLFMFLISGCEESQSLGKNQITSDSKVPVVLIFCDLTTSVDPSSIKKVARDAYNLILSFPHNTKLIIYPIDESPFVKPILDFTYPSKATKSSEIHKNKTIVKRAAKFAYDTILQLYQDEYSSDKAGNRAISCMMRSLETAHSQFLQYKNVKGNNYSYELIYLSDMLEECSTSPVGAIFFTKQYFKDALKKLDTYKPDFDLSYADVTIIISVEQYATASAYISYEELKNAWKNVFIKAGFSAEQFSGFNFLPTIPPKFDLKNSEWK